MAAMTGDEGGALAKALAGASAGATDLGPLVDAVRAGATVLAALGLPAGTADLLYAQAHARFAAGRPGEALPLFHALCVLDGRAVDHWLGLGICLRHAARTDEARIAFQTARRLDPDAPSPAYHMAELLMQAGEVAAARVCLDVFARAPMGPAKASLAAGAARLAAAAA